MIRTSRGAVLVWRQAGEPAAALSRARDRRWELRSRNGRARVYAPVSVDSSAVTLTIDSTTHAHTADNLALSLDGTLAIQSAAHGHAADSLALSSDSWLTVADSTHGHVADSADLSTAPSLSIAGADHGHTADTLALSWIANLAIADATHAHAAESPTLTKSSSGTGATAEEIAAAVRVELAAELLRIMRLHKIHGLEAGMPLVVTPSSRVAGDVAQSISAAGDTVTVESA